MYKWTADNKHNPNRIDLEQQWVSLQERGWEPGMLELRPPYLELQRPDPPWTWILYFSAMWKESQSLVCPPWPKQLLPQSHHTTEHIALTALLTEPKDWTVQYTFTHAAVFIYYLWKTDTLLMKDISWQSLFLLMHRITDWSYSLELVIICLSHSLNSITCLWYSIMAPETLQKLVLTSFKPISFSVKTTLNYNCHGLGWEWHAFFCFLGLVYLSWPCLLSSLSPVLLQSVLSLWFSTSLPSVHFPDYFHLLFVPLCI